MRHVIGFDTLFQVSKTAHCVVSEPEMLACQLVWEFGPRASKVLLCEREASLNPGKVDMMGVVSQDSTRLSLCWYYHREHLTSRTRRK